MIAHDGRNFSNKTGIHRRVYPHPYHRTIHFFKEHQCLFRIFIKEITYNEELHTKVSTHIETETLKRLETIIQHFQERGEVIQIPAKIIGRKIFTSLTGYFLFRFLYFPGSKFLEDETEIAYLARMIINGIKS